MSFSKVDLEVRVEEELVNINVVSSNFSCLVRNGRSFCSFSVMVW